MREQRCFAAGREPETSTETTMKQRLVILPQSSVIGDASILLTPRTPCERDGNKARRCIARMRMGSAAYERGDLEHRLVTRLPEHPSRTSCEARRSLPVARTMIASLVVRLIRIVALIARVVHAVVAKHDAALLGRRMEDCSQSPKVNTHRFCVGRAHGFERGSRGGRLSVACNCAITHFTMRRLARSEAGGGLRRVSDGPQLACLPASIGLRRVRDRRQVCVAGTRHAKRLKNLASQQNVSPVLSRRLPRRVRGSNSRRPSIGTPCRLDPDCDLWCALAAGGARKTVPAPTLAASRHVDNRRSQPIGQPGCMTQEPPRCHRNLKLNELAVDAIASKVPVYGPIEIELAFVPQASSPHVQRSTCSLDAVAKTVLRSTASAIALLPAIIGGDVSPWSIRMTAVFACCRADGQHGPPQEGAGHPKSAVARHQPKSVPPSSAATHNATSSTVTAGAFHHVNSEQVATAASTSSSARVGRRASTSDVRSAGDAVKAGSIKAERAYSKNIRPAVFVV